MNKNTSINSINKYIHIIYLEKYFYKGNEMKSLEELISIVGKNRRYLMTILKQKNNSSFAPIDEEVKSQINVIFRS